MKLTKMEGEGKQGEKQFKSAKLIIFIIMSQYLKLCVSSEIYLNQ